MLARLGFFIITPLLVAAVLVTPQLVTAPYSEAATTSEPQPAAGIDFHTVTSGDARRNLTEDEVTDVYGNEITAAVATYKFDATGTLYELHSPQTERPRLASPKS
jgi:hypothetical protein